MKSVETMRPQCACNFVCTPRVSVCFACARYLSPYYYVDFNGTELEVNLTELHSEKSGRCGYEGAPSLVAQADVFVHASGYVWNDKASYELNVDGVGVTAFAEIFASNANAVALLKLGFTWRERLPRGRRVWI